MTLTISDSPVPLRVDDAGVVRVGKSRVLLELVIHAYNRGDSAEEIVYQYDALRLADVHAVIAYYLNHRDEVDTYIIEREAEAERTLQHLEVRFPQEGLRERLQQRLVKRQQNREDFVG